LAVSAVTSPAAAAVVVVVAGAVAAGDAVVADDEALVLLELLPQLDSATTTKADANIAVVRFLLSTLPFITSPPLPSSTMPT
jgi:hypothetical protein